MPFELYLFKDNHKMFGKKKIDNSIDPEQHELLENAQRRIKQKKRFISHAIIFLIGCVFLILTNKILKYGDAYDWSIWIILLWGFILALHCIQVFIIQRLMSRDWERKQREKLVAIQKKKIAELQKEIETDFPLSGINKKKD